MPAQSFPLASFSSQEPLLGFRTLNFTSFGAVSSAGGAAAAAGGVGAEQQVSSLAVAVLSHSSIPLSV